nr:reverse transcriptase domain-containing protein [Tanacetum cinerariifolium]
MHAWINVEAIPRVEAKYTPRLPFAAFSDDSLFLIVRSASKSIDFAKRLKKLEMSLVPRVEAKHTPRLPFSASRVTLIRLNFDEEEYTNERPPIVTGKKQILDETVRGWFERLPSRSINEWLELRDQFTTTFSTRLGCFKDLTEIAKIVRKANEMLVAFKERWTVETGFILGGPEIMKILLLMDAHKCPELAKRTELPKGEYYDSSKRGHDFAPRRDDMLPWANNGADRRRNDGRNTYNNRDVRAPYRPKDHHVPYPPPRGNFHGNDRARVDLNTLTKYPKEVLAATTEQEESWMNVPITFPPISSKDFSNEPTIMEEKVEGHLVCRIYVDERASVESYHIFHPFDDEISPLMGIETLVTETVIISDCNRLEKKQMKIKAEPIEEQKEVGLTKEVLVNPGYPYQLVTIGGYFSSLCKGKLRMLLKKNMDVFGWKPFDMTGVPRCIIEHTLHVNATIEPVRQKRRVMAPDKSLSVMKEVDERLKARIVRLFSLTYGSKDVIPAKIGMLTHKTLVIPEDENEDAQCLNLDLLQGRRKVTAIREAKYKSKVEQYYIRRVTEAFYNGSYKLQTMEDKERSATRCRSFTFGPNVLEATQWESKGFSSTPIDTEKPLLKDPDGEDVDVHIYMSMLVSLMYLTLSRQDIMFAVYACARF